MFPVMYSLTAQWLSGIERMIIFHMRPQRVEQGFWTNVDSCVLIAFLCKKTGK
jgi:hypothetical protein